MADQIKEHIERCVELYGAPIDDEFEATVARPTHEQMRADLMLAVGMLMALRP